MPREAGHSLVDDGLHVLQSHLFPFFGIRRRPGADEPARAHLERVAEHHLQEDVAAQGKARHGGGGYVERAQERRHIVGHHRDRDGAARMPRPPHAAQVGAQEPVASLQGFHLRRPDRVIQRKAMQEQERRPAPRFLISEVDSVYGYGFHCALPSCLNRLVGAEL